jgi:hypothetical protein
LCFGFGFRWLTFCVCVDDLFLLLGRGRCDNEDSNALNLACNSALVIVGGGGCRRRNALNLSCKSVIVGGG